MCFRLVPVFVGIKSLNGRPQSESSHLGPSSLWQALLSLPSFSTWRDACPTQNDIWAKSWIIYQLFQKIQRSTALEELSFAFFVADMASANKIGVTFLSDPGLIIYLPCQSLTDWLLLLRLNWCGPGVWRCASCRWLFHGDVAFFVTKSCRTQHVGPNFEAKVLSRLWGWNWSRFWKWISLKLKFKNVRASCCWSSDLIFVIFSSKCEHCCNRWFNQRPLRDLLPNLRCQILAIWKSPTAPEWPM